MTRRSRFSRFPRHVAPAMVTVLSAVLVLASATSVGADAPADADPAIQYRHKLMEAIGSNMAAIADIMKYGLDLPGHVENHARQLEKSAALIAGAFKAKVVEGPTDAKPEIWQDWAKFEQAIADYEKAAGAFASAAAGSDGEAIGAAMKGLGKSCSGCHKSFRKPKEESYKNQ
ncbi:MAG: cytochrome c [Deltaproteobacteria bacterium]|nr:cytochrome c [Deltaproteobacteria bacterium]MBW2499909.1 cytochrome c [Deltaproteobacteria bacterium]